jgi:hypothetical protein
MTITPAKARPGSILTLGFPDEGVRGLGYSLESAGATGWTLEYYLAASRKGEGEPGRRSWTRINNGNGNDGVGFGYPDLGVTGPGGERLRVPDVATPGVYRLCTAPPAQATCVQLTIT